MANPNPPNPLDPPNLPEMPSRDFYRALVDSLRDRRSQGIKSIPCENYRSGHDFDLWIVNFIDTVRATNGLTATDPRLDGLCLNWLSTKLEVGPTRSVYDNLDDGIKNNWTALRNALSRAYKDDTEEIRFLSRDDAWKRTDGMSLMDYKNGLLHGMTKYQADLRTVQGEWDRTAVRRYRAGLQNPVLEAHILMQCTGANHTLAHAHNIATNYENTLNTISQSGSSLSMPNMATMLSILQMASLSFETPSSEPITREGE